MALGFIHRVAILVLHGFVDRLTFLFRVDFTFFNVVDCVWSFPALGMVRCLTFFFVSHFVANIIIRVAFLVVTMITSLCGNRQSCSMFYFIIYYKLSIYLMSDKKGVGIDIEYVISSNYTVHYC